MTNDNDDTTDEAPETPGPDPARTPGLEPGGSVPPGETPPGEASASQGLSHRQEATGRPTKWIWMGVIAVVVLLFALFLMMRAIALVP